MTSEPTYEYWREYPERDPQAVVWYPCIYGPLDPDDIWRAGPAASPGSRKKGIGYYIHVPLCKQVCKYCPFNKYRWTPSRAAQYLQAVKEEIRAVAARSYFQKTQVIAGYLGGGTPTALEAGEIAGLIEWCHRHFDVAPDAELCVEATPDTIDAEKLRVLRDLGVNRLSIGVQSFNSRLLRIMGRAPTPRQSLRAIELAHRIGFEVLTIDLLYRVPGQTLVDWEEDLRQAADLDLDHLTAFSLAIDPGTALYHEISRGKVMTQADEETELAMYGLAVDILGAAGYQLYTLYDFARKGKECLHHALNWRAPQGDYAGFGPGAFSFIQNERESFIYCNLSSLNKYADCVRQGRQPVDFGKKLTPEEEMSRYLVLGVNFLRVPLAPFRERFGVDLTQIYGQAISKLKSWGLIQIDDREMALTDKGKKYLANVSKMFFTDESRGKPHVIGVELQKGEGLSLIGLNREESEHR